MNGTVANISISSICKICQTNYGFNSTDRRSIIVLVVFASVALIVCYIGVLFYAIRMRYIPEDELAIIPNNMCTNPAFDNQDEKEEIIRVNESPMFNPMMTQPAVVTIENKETFF